MVFGFFLLSITYLELVFKLRVLTLNSEMAVGRILLFTISYSILILFLLKFFSEVTAKRLTYTIIGVMTFLYINQELYSIFYKGLFLSLNTSKDVGLGLSFLNKYFKSLAFGQLLYLLPVVVLFGLRKYRFISFKISYKNLRAPLYFLIGFSFIFFTALQTISEEDPHPELDFSYSEMDLYTYMYDPQAGIKKFGLLTYTQRDFFSLFRTDPLSEDQHTVLLDNYFSEQPEHYDNAYSDIFEDKNFIMITAESLDTFAINETLTPNLYNLMENYSYFENYYSPLYYRSTADTEFQVQTGFYPDKNVTLSMEYYLENEFPNTLPKLFETKGYETFSFHNYTDYFYPRARFHEETLGYNQYFGAVDMGMFDAEPTGIVNNHEWQSDLEMMEFALPHFINESKFFVNFLTVSGHLNYTENHDVGINHEAEVLQYEIDNGIDLPDELFWYLAANIELDNAIGYLMDELEAANKLEDTVIIIFSDHYAYGIDDNTIWGYDTIKEPFNESDLHNVPFILVNNDPSITIFDTNKTNYMASVDILPTVSNLFGLPINYKHVFGVDALASENNIVRLPDLSFISKDFSYDSISEVYQIYENVVTPEYLEIIKQQIINDYMNNLNALEIDYFKEEEDITE